MRNHSDFTLARRGQTDGVQPAIPYVALKDEMFFTLFPFVIAGTRQVKTATAVGTITLAGNAVVTVTAAGMTGSPKAYNVPVLLNDTAVQCAAKVVDVLNADAAFTAMFTAAVNGADIVVSRIIEAANDGTMNVALANGTCTGITAAPTAANTTAGAASGNAMTLNVEIQSPNGDWHPAVAAVAISTAGAQAPIRFEHFGNAIRARLSSWTAGQLTLTGLKGAMQ